MYMHDPFLRMGYARRARRVRWQWGWRPPTPEAPVRRPYRRRLAAIERALEVEVPALSARFAVFNQLTDGERPVGAEQVRSLAWPRPRRVHLALALVVAAFAALCVTLGVQSGRPVPRCPVTAAAGAVAHAPVRDLPCRAYPTAK